MMTRTRRQDGSAQNRETTKSVVQVTPESRRIIEELAALQAQRDSLADIARHMRQEINRAIDGKPRTRYRRRKIAPKR